METGDDGKMKPKPGSNYADQQKVFEDMVSVKY